MSPPPPFGHVNIGSPIGMNGGSCVVVGVVGVVMVLWNGLVIWVVSVICPVSCCVVIFGVI